MKLIINADDYGMRPAIDAAVEHLLQIGVVTSASLMVTGSSAGDAAAFLAKNARFGAGLHLDLDMVFSSAGFGKDDHGRFLVPDIFFDQEEVRSAIREQLARQFGLFREMTGRVPDHLNGHRHVHLFPPVLELMMPFLKEHSIPCIRFFPSFYADPPQAAAIRDLLEQNALISTKIFTDGPHLPAPELACSAEVMVHIALPAAAEQKSRLREYALLADEAFRRSLESPGYELCSFAELAAAHGQCPQGGA
ncbi:MAG: ChbG/HpnK family deacetylase [Spirochaetota bacterium]|jgi:predicted glycoside hydrolase/deacetylase ChbG (UPF0249 family)|nr:ChbG/HpnK family deacetylase [Spirochaetota bacterium]